MTVCNVIELFKHPIAGKENGPVFKYTIREINQSTACIKIPSIEFVRREVPEGNRNKEGVAQKKRLSGTPVAGFLPLMIPCGFDILETGTCSYVPIGKYVATYARTSEAIVIHRKFYHLALGGFFPSTGVNVLIDSGDSAVMNVGAVPTILAEVQPVIVVSLDSGNDKKSKCTKTLPYSRPLKISLAKGRQRL